MIGPIGLDKVFTATAHAKRNPMAVPNTVGQHRSECAANTTERAGNKE